MVASLEDVDVVVGQMTRRIGKSFVQLDTRIAVDIADGVAFPGRGVFRYSMDSAFCIVGETGDVMSRDVFLE